MLERECRPLQAIPFLKSISLQQTMTREKVEVPMDFETCYIVIFISMEITASFKTITSLSIYRSILIEVYLKKNILRQKLGD